MLNNWTLTRNDKDLETFIRNCGPIRYKFSDVKKMTNSFLDEVGRGGFGKVYKGKLPNGSFVAVKLLEASRWKGEDFVNEVSSISRTSHVNIVTLLGFCLEGNKKALIYEFVPNGSLAKFIYNDRITPNNTSPLLSWEKLQQIALGIARGLEYLHQGCNARILHLDIKPQNILLDENFSPKIADFGLAKLCPGRDSITSMTQARGTLGYIAPEAWNRNFGISNKSDVYSYGMMILEMAGGRKNLNTEASHSSLLYFPQWIYNHLEQGNNLRINGVITTEDNEIAKKMVLVGLWCIQTTPSDRPSISRVIGMLEANMESLQVPPNPFLPSQLPASSLTPPTSTELDTSSELDVSESNLRPTIQTTRTAVDDVPLPQLQASPNSATSSELGVSESNLQTIQATWTAFDDVPPQQAPPSVMATSNPSPILPVPLHAPLHIPTSSLPPISPISPPSLPPIYVRPPPDNISSSHNSVMTPYTPVSEEANFRGVGKIRKVFIPVLEEAISQHPHLWTSQEGRTIQCRRWAYSALGRVLYFLRNVKIKDLTMEKKAEFDKLWGEMDLFNFDLTWLAIKHDQVMNASVDDEMLKAVEEQKEKISSLELDISEMKLQLMEAEHMLEEQKVVLAALDRNLPNLDSVIDF
ncbi:Receptor-like kinase [Quillaja saponaria]|uniref:Receptor-like kinase n=1 Tax=Quillaja saponaria TaxID=32244 RepID=A0AAD7M5I9_QUISA|nr:Receptor-like kinase [Quillaja saponaria]